MMKRFAPDALINAILQGSQARVGAALALDPGIVNERNSDGFMPLHAAAQENSPEIATLLLLNGADPNGLALVETQVEGAQHREALIKWGIDPNTRMISVQMVTALYIASSNGYDWLRSDPYSETLAWSASSTRS